MNKPTVDIWFSAYGVRQDHPTWSFMPICVNTYYSKVLYAFKGSKEKQKYQYKGSIEQPMVLTDCPLLQIHFEEHNITDIRSLIDMFSFFNHYPNVINNLTTGLLHVDDLKA